ncbi:MAG: DUF2288 domain-containing protein [Marinicella sp.]
MQQENKSQKESIQDANEGQDTRAQIEKEMAVISFQELQKFFAKGLMIKVDVGLNLVDVAMQIHADNTQQIQAWLDNNELIRAHDDHAKKWVADRSEFNAVTVAPWVLVQELVTSKQMKEDS